MRAGSLGLALLVKDRSLGLAGCWRRNVEIQSRSESVALARASHDIASVIVWDIGVGEAPCRSSRSLCGSLLAELEDRSSFLGC